MAKVRIATFNVQNLFARFKFEGGFTDDEIDNMVADGWEIDKTKFDISDHDQREITGRAIRNLNADVIVLQEVENMDVLKRFNTRYLRHKKFRYKMLIDGNDPRLIDIAVLSNYPIDYIRTHQFTRTPNHRNIFSRDCLELGINVEGTVLPIFANHLKSMFGGREETMRRREIQCEELVKILQERFGNDPGTEDWVLLGDLNDYMPSEGLDPLFSTNWIENVVDRLPQDERWTYLFRGDYNQLDYVLLSRSLAAKNANVLPEIDRRGMPPKMKKYTGPRYTEVTNSLYASDHCPVLMEVDLG